MENIIVEGFRLSPQQKRRWLLAQTEQRGSLSAQCSIVVTGKLDVPTLNDAAARVISRHEILRTTFRSLPGVDFPLQVITDDSATVAESSLSGMGTEEQREGVEQLLASERERAWDYEHGPLVRLRLIDLGDDEQVLGVTLPAMCADTRTLTLFVAELSAVYAGETTDAEAMQYADVSEWQNNLLEAEAMSSARDYWSKQEWGECARLRLPFEGGQRAVGEREFEAGRHELELSEEKFGEIEAAAREHGASAAAWLQACWQVLLWRLTGQPSEFALGVVHDGRRHAELSDVLGPLARLLPVRAKLHEGQPFGEVLAQTEAARQEAARWQEYFSWEALDPTVAEAELGASLCAAQFEFERLTIQLPAALALAEVSDYADPLKLKLRCIETDERGDARKLCAEIFWNRELLSKDAAEVLSEELSALIDDSLARPTGAIDELSLAAGDRLPQRLARWNQTRDESTRGKCIHEVFEAQAALSPDAVAVIYEDEQITYGELNRRANALAHHLRGLGVGPDVLVGLMLERSVELVVAMLGVLKAGGAYLPLDASYPAERIAFMFEDAAANVLLVNGPVADGYMPPAAHVIDLEADRALLAAQNTENPPHTADARNLAYIIYTSGSTGRPKGVMISHGSICNRLLWMVAAFPLTADDRILQKTPISFDASVWEFFVPLFAGAQVVMARPGGHQDSAYLRKTVAEQQITTLQLVPSMLQVFLEGDDLKGCNCLRRVFCGGETLPLKLQERFFVNLDASLQNLYGPTEVSIDAAYWICQKDSNRPSVPIGRALSNTQIHILDAQLNPAPIGIAGELYVGGDGLARGYLNRPALTAERFVPDSFSPSPGQRLYRTGDLARFLPDGSIDYLGRGDQQVKLRGYRIELGEIEAVLAAHPAVREAIVVARDETGADRRLVAYLVPAAAAAARPTPAVLRAHLRERLPDYMVPSAFVLLDALPLTPNGKVDRRALPAPDAPTGTPDSGYVAPRTPTEEVLCGIWTEVLGTPRVGIDDDFFELGGHSLLATQVVSRVREALQVEVPLRALFEASRPRQLAARVDTLLRGGTSAVAPPLIKVMNGGDAPLSFAQQRLWFLDQLEPGSPAYNIPAAVRLTGALNVAALERTLDEVVRRHEVLRTVFVSEAGQPRQLVREHTAQTLEVTDLSHLPQVEREVEARLRASEEAQRPFDLGRGPLLRTSLLKLGAEEHVLLLTMHHIVSDGWSAGVLVREMGALYAAYAQGGESPLEELTIQYGDYARWQREWLQGEVLEEQLGYWREQLAGAPPVLELPTDRPRPASLSLRGGREIFTIAEGTAEALRALGRSEGATLFMTLLAAFDVLLARYTGQDDIVIGTPIAGRTRAEVEGLIGFFVNTLVVRARVDAELSFREVLGRVKEACLGAYAHQDVPFEKLVEELHPERSLTHTPLFQVMFSFQVAGAERLRLAGLELEGIGTEAEASKFDLTLWITEGEHGLNASIEYNTDLFDATTIERIAGHLRVLLDAAAADPDRRVSALPLLTEPEQQKFARWNDTDAAYPSDLCVHELFERQATLQPEAVAVIHEDERLTYAELNEQAERLAQHLRSLGVGPESRVGILLKRSSRVVVALLGVWKAGGAYVPLDPAYPRERLSFMLEDSGAEVLLTQPELMNVLPHGAARIVDVGEMLSGVADDKEAGDVHRKDVARRVSADNLAYIIYTSGSTGRPKGVAISHRSCVAFIHWAHATFDPRDLAVVLASTSICFDLSVFELFVPLSLGTRIVLADDALALPTLAARDEVTLVNTVPSAMAALVESGGVPRGVRAVNLAGEALQRELVERVYGQGGVERVMNLYGPTEDTTYSTGTLVERGGGMVSIGRPIANTRAYVLDRQMRVVPVGVAGEIYLGGEGLARGYLGRPELTAERFVPHPFSTEPGGRLYRTGDVARYLSDGEIEYLGRIDQQVKVRGFRIELGEIEAALLQHAGVRQA
ncbi:MAG TPA: amino acid adenylation domain-containing protein, partial [Pyrinomonadaceae bacterium]